jgi:hypothetical protein
MPQAIIVSGETDSEIEMRYNTSGNHSGTLYVRDLEFGCEVLENVQIKVMPKPQTGAINHD